MDYIRFCKFQNKLRRRQIEFLSTKEKTINKNLLLNHVLLLISMNGMKDQPLRSFLASAQSPNVRSHL